jgi:hypothetical protein
MFLVTLMVAWVCLLQTVQNWQQLDELRQHGFTGQFLFVVCNLALYSAQVAFTLLAVIRG